MRGVFATPRCRISTPLYTFARYLLRDPADADDAVQELLPAGRCAISIRSEVRTSSRGCSPSLNVCRAEFGRRSGVALTMDGETEEDEDAAPLWQEAPGSPEVEMLRQWDAKTIHRLVAELPDPFRETIVLREINDLSYSEIAHVVGVPVGTVMSRLARARSMLRKAWSAQEGPST